MPDEKGETEKAKTKGQTKQKNPYPEPVEYLRFEASETLKPKSTKKVTFLSDQ